MNAVTAQGVIAAANTTKWLDNTRSRRQKAGMR